MKRLLSLFVVALLALVVGCGNESDNVQFTLDKSEVEIPAGGGMVEVRVLSNVAWELTGFTSWCTPSVKSGKGSATGEVVVFTAERADRERKVTYHFKAGGESFDLVVMQKMVPQLKAADSNIRWVVPEGGVVTLNYEANIECEIVIPAEAEEWLSMDTRALSLHRTGVHAAPNTSGYSREAEVVVRSVENPQMSLRFTVRQPSDKNLIRYSTTDGKILELKSSAFNTPIINNIYLDDVAFLEFEAPLTTIGEQAFYISYNNTLKSIILPNTVERIGGAAFNECYRLESIVLPESLRTVGDVAFQGCGALEELSFPDGVTTIGDGVCRGCINLRKVTMTDSVTSLGILCFEELEVLEEVRLSDSLTTLPSSTFYYCTSLRKANIPKSAELIECYAFCACPLLEEATLPATLKQIGEYAFMSCRSLSEISIPEGVTTMEDHCFGDCIKMESIVLPESLEVLGMNAFWGCVSLREVVIPEGVAELRSGVFSACESLDGVVLPQSLRVIGDSAFEGCISLTDIDVPATVTYINQSAFAHCYSLERAVVRNEQLKQIQRNAFAHCYALERLELYAVAPPQLLEFNIFDGCSESLGVYVPAESVEAYMSDAAWSTYARYIHALE